MSALKEAYRQKAEQLANAGRVKVQAPAYGNVQEMPDGGAFVELVVFVSADALAENMTRPRCWRRRSPCVRCAAAALDEIGEMLAATGYDSPEAVAALHDLKTGGRA